MWRRFENDKHIESVTATMCYCLRNVVVNRTNWCEREHKKKKISHSNVCCFFFVFFCLAFFSTRKNCIDENHRQKDRSNANLYVYLLHLSLKLTIIVSYFVFIGQKFNKKKKIEKEENYLIAKSAYGFIAIFLIFCAFVFLSLIFRLFTWHHGTYKALLCLVYQNTVSLFSSFFILFFFHRFWF